MRFIVIFIVFLLSACSKISDEEKSLVGYWEWDVSDGDNGESGFLHLRDDRSYSYRIVSKTPTERVVQEKIDYFQYWRLNKNFVCTVTEWESATIVKEENIIQEECFWEVRKNSKNEKYLTLKAGLSNGEINATRTKN